MRLKKLANLYLVLGVTIAALWPVMLGFAVEMNPAEFVFLSYMVAIPPSLVFVATSGNLSSFKDLFRKKKSLLMLLAVGIFNYGYADFGMIYSQRFISSALASVVFWSYPLLMLPMLPLILRERVTKKQVTALSIAFVGLIIVLAGGTQVYSSSTFAATVLGISIVLSCSIATAVSLAVIKKYVVDTRSAILFFNLTSAIVFGLVFAVQGVGFSTLNAREITAILYVGVVYNVLFAFMYYLSLKMLKTTLVTNSYLIVPFISFIFALLLLGEKILLSYVILACFVTAGLLIQRFDKKGGSYIAERRVALKNLPIFEVTGVFANTNDKGIADAIRKGGSVLAAKLNRNNSNAIQEVVEKKKWQNVFTDESVAISKEIDFLKDILNAGKADFVLVKVGNTEENEVFFSQVAVIKGKNENYKGKVDLT